MASHHAALRPPGACDKACHPSILSPVRTFSISSGVIPAKRLTTVTFCLPSIVDSDPSRRVWVNGQIYPSCIYHKVTNLSSKIWLGRGIGSISASLRCWRLIFETLTPTWEPADRRSGVVSGALRGGTSRQRPLRVALSERPRNCRFRAQGLWHGHAGRGGVTGRKDAKRHRPPAQKRRGIPSGYPATRERPKGRSRATTRVAPTTRATATAAEPPASMARRSCRGRHQRQRPHATLRPSATPRGKANPPLTPTPAGWLTANCFRTRR